MIDTYLYETLGKTALVSNTDCPSYNHPGTENMTCEEFCQKYPQPAVCSRLQNGIIARPTRKCCECDGCGREPFTMGPMPPMPPSTSLPDLEGMINNNTQNYCNTN